METVPTNPVKRKTIDCSFVPPGDLADVLERAGWVLDRHRRRAQCPECSGNSTFTVAIYTDHAFCHRCKKLWNQRSFGIIVPPDPKLVKARKRVALFIEWKDTCEEILCDEIYRLGRAAEDAKWVLGESVKPTSPAVQEFLKAHPEVIDDAWDSLATYYRSRVAIEEALDQLTFNPLSEWWLEFPMKPEVLFRAFEEALARV